GRIGISRVADVVDADDRQVVRDANLAAPRRVNDAHRHLVVEAEDRGGWLLAPQQALAGDHARVDRKIAVDDDEMPLRLLFPGAGPRAAQPLVADVTE